MNIFNRRRSLSGASQRSRTRSMSGSFRRRRNSSTSGNDAGLVNLNTEPLELSLQLSNQKMFLKDGAWETDKDMHKASQMEIKRLRGIIKQLETDKAETTRNAIRLQEEKNLLHFQNQVLIELLATAQLDAEKNNEEWQKEELKTQALKWELANTNLEMYRLKKQPIHHQQPSETF